MKSDVIIQLHKNFEDYAHQIDGEEFWFARDLQGLLGYSKWENFAKVIDKAKIACQTAGHSASDHFPDVRKTIQLGKQPNNLGARHAQSFYPLLQSAHIHPPSCPTTRS